METGDLFAIRFSSDAEKDLKRLRQWGSVPLNAILTLKSNPTRGHTLSGSLRGARALEFNLKGSGAFRAVYILAETARECLIIAIGPHESVYETAERRFAALKRFGDVPTDD